MLLPVDPLGIKLFFKVTKFHQDAKFGPGTYAYFPNVPPGYYKVRQWSDYGAPITETRLDSSGKPVKVERDIGKRPVTRASRRSFRSSAQFLHMP